MKNKKSDILQILHECGDGADCDKCPMNGRRDCVGTTMRRAERKFVSLRAQLLKLNGELAQSVERLLQLAEDVSEYKAAVESYLEKENEGRNGTD